MKYSFIISGSVQRTGRTDSRDALRAAHYFGCREDGETVTVYEGGREIARAAWDADSRRYYRVYA